MGNILKIKSTNKEYKIIFIIHPKYKTLKPIFINSKKIF
jgi:hypothetical protein